jgi:penicillin V acylase-like amidase (Ntn superfamily)
MKKSVLLSVLIISAGLQFAVACTTFFINKDGQLIFGRNYDWISDAGIVCTNLRGLAKTSVKMQDGKPISWVSKYGSITFNQYGKEFPTGGMNEKGLVVEIMWADGSRYPDADDRAALNVLQWVQYQLDSHSTIEEVISSDGLVRISSNNPPLHYLIADAKGNAAAIEFLDGKTVVHKGKDLPFPVLTNSSYSVSAKTATDANILTGDTSFSFQDNSLQRFTQACSMVQKYQHSQVRKPIVEYGFDILDNVSQKEFTKWSIVYDLKNKKIYFKTANYQDIKSFTFKAFDFNCPSDTKALNMNQSLKGDVNKKFIRFSDKVNREILDKAAKESASVIPLSEKDKEGNVTYASQIKCRN